MNLHPRTPPATASALLRGSRLTGAFIGALATLTLAGCGLEVPSSYSFESRAEAGASSVSYTGQIQRHVLMADLKSHLDGLTARLDSSTDPFVPESGDVVDELGFFYEFDADTSGSTAVGLSSTTPLLQATYADFDNGANLKSKLAGNDAVGQHKDWSTDFAGWDGAASPEALLVDWFDTVDTLAVDRANGIIPLTPSGSALTSATVTPQGQDLAQLVQKFLLGAVAFSQGTDDYLDDDIDGKGLLSSNVLEDGALHTALEHQWDEGFGYFGAARDYADYTDEEIAGAGGRPERSGGYFDTDGDGAIDLTSERNFGHSLNAAKRDRGSSADAPTDFTQDAFDAFVRGRAIISAAVGGPLNDGQLAELRIQRDLAVAAWEKAIAATVVHYINDVLADLESSGPDAIDDATFYDLAKHWSEAKGFALSFQFNPRSPVSDADFVTLHEKLGDAPAIPGEDDVATYRAGLIEARDLLQAAYGFAAANMGDENGQGGW